MQTPADHATPTKILVIDDDPAILTSVSAFLQENGYETYGAPSGEDGLSVCMEVQPDLVVTDLRMPGVGGIGVVTELHRKHPDMPVIVISGTGVVADAIDSVRAGAWDFVTKPIEEMNVLTHVVERALERARLLLERRAYREQLEWEVAARTAELESANRALTREIEERKRAEADRERIEEQFRHAQKMEAVGQLAGGVAHDFNNILTAIIGNVDLAIATLSRQPVAGDSLLRHLKEIELSTDHATTLTRQLLTFSRRELHRPTVVDLNQILDRFQRILQRLLGAEIKLATDLCPDLRPLRADPGQVEQVVLNLVVNARDAMQSGGQLTLITQNADVNEAQAATMPLAHAGSFVMLAVCDTGCGMDTETVSRIFEPFFTTKASGRGTGLGLSTVYGIIEQVGGHVCVDSKPGEGSTFRVYWPAAQAPTTTGTDDASDAQAPTGTETILVCDDDALIRNLTQQCLAHAGYTMVTAADGNQTLQAARAYKGQIDLLVTDVVLPDISGPKLADRITSSRPGLKTLFISGHSSDIVAQQGVGQDEIDFLNKPFGNRELLCAVRDALDRK